MIEHNLNPVLLTIGALEIRYYGLVYVIGVFLGIYFLSYYIKKNKIDLTKNQMWDLVFYLMLGVVIGSRLFEVIVWNPAYYLANPLKILFVWEGGMAFHGGFIGILVAGYFYKRKNPKINALQIADILSIPALIALALGRVANFINAELWGTVSNLPWCVKFPDVEGCRHPVQIYSAIKRFVVVGLLAILFLKPRKHGFIFLNLVLWTGLGRFFIDFLRVDVRYLGLSIGQYASIVMVLGAGFILFKYYRKNFKV